MIGSKHIKKPQKVLVVDDFEINRDVLGMILEDDYEVLYAENGEEALSIIRRHLQDLSIVLLDLMMPVMDGFAVLDYVRHDEEMRRIPIIVLTADKSAELKALQMGAADFITKPFDVHEIILARVGRIIELSEGRQLISAAEHDQLTQLYSRNFFFEYAERIYTYHPEMHMDAVVIDIEQFHSINDLNGRAFGDDVLRLLGNEIRNFLSETEGIASRFDADRFEIYCIHQEDYHPLLKRLQDKVNLISPNVNIHLRMGIKPWREGVEPVLLFDGARAACNMVRGNYQDPLMVYDEDMRERENLNQRLLNDLRSAIDKRQFQVYYQPKYSVKSFPPKLCSAEALIRWNHPEIGMISPGTFIPLFEGNGLISMVDRFVWEEAAAQCAAWKKKYNRTIPVSVNISRADLFEPDFVDGFKDLINRNGLESKDIKLEITESAYTENMKEFLEVIDRLRSTGFEIEMDDFGSGYSSLNMLSEVPFDILKMDMKFIRNLETSATDRRLVELILDIARYLKVMVVAEGVETKEQLEFLTEWGCDLIQGYYFSRPLPAAEFMRLLDREIDHMG